MLIESVKPKSTPGKLSKKQVVSMLNKLDRVDSYKNLGVRGEILASNRLFHSSKIVPMAQARERLSILILTHGNRHRGLSKKQLISKLNKLDKVNSYENPKRRGVVKATPKTVGIPRLVSMKQARERLDMLLILHGDPDI